MQNGCRRLVPVLIAVDPGTVTDIQIFQISKMRFVKIADLLKYLTSVNCRSATG